MSIYPGCYLLWALMLLVIPLPWLAATMTAAAIHELFHIAAVYLSRGKILGLQVHPGGAVIHTGPLTQSQELVCALAGPLGSLLLLCFSHRFPRAALCGGIQGIFNLLPFYPLDGGRAVRCMLRLFVPLYESQIENCLEGMVFLFLFLLAVRYRSAAVLLLLCCVGCKIIMRKKPCKARLFRVQ